MNQMPLIAVPACPSCGGVPMLNERDDDSEETYINGDESHTFWMVLCTGADCEWNVRGRNGQSAEEVLRMWCRRVTPACTEMVPLAIFAWPYLDREDKNALSREATRLADERIIDAI